MNSVTVNRALGTLVLADLNLEMVSGNAYATAIRISMGFTDTQSLVIFPDRIPSPVVVADISGLSLPHLEFRNIVLSRATTVEFLQNSKSDIPPGFLLHEVFTPEVYKLHFNRSPVKIKRRQVFTYTEVLSLVQYGGSVELPSWL